MNISEEGWRWVHDRSDKTNDQKVRNKAEQNTVYQACLRVLPVSEAAVLSDVPFQSLRAELRV